MTGTARQTEEALSRFESEGGAPGKSDDRGGLEVGDAEHRGRILLVYAARESHTSVIADALATRLRRHGFAVEIGDASAGAMPPPQDYDGVVLGAPMRASRETDLIARYVQEHRDGLEELPSAVFAVSSSGIPHDLDPREFIDKLSGAVHWQPTIMAAFAGGEPYPREGLLLLLARREREQRRLDGQSLRTNWIDVERFADAIAVELARAAVGAERTEPHARAE